MVSMQAGLSDKPKTLLGKFKFEYSLTKDDIRKRKLATNLILASLPSEYDQFVMNFNMHGMEKTLAELHRMLKNAEQRIKKTSPVLVVQKAKGTKGKSKPKSKNKVGPYTKGKVAYTRGKS